MNADVLDLTSALERWRRAGLLRRRRCVRTEAGGWCTVEGRRLRNFASNDYLDLAHDPRLIEAAGMALPQAGVGSGASALVVGRSPWHEALEERLARFENQPGCVLFPTGYAANVGTIAALVDRRDTIFSDSLNHASLIDGCRLSRAHVEIYEHRDLDQLEHALSRGERSGRSWIVTDTVFSMDGDLAPLPELCDLAERYGAFVLVDEAHATGVFGTDGRGVCELFNVESRVHVRVGTLSKAIGTLGGFVTGSRELVDWLWNRARTQMFSTALPASVCAAACAAIDIIQSEPERRQRLLELARSLHTALRQIGLPIPDDVAGPIVPVIVGEPERTVEVARRLEERGLLVAAIRPPTVPPGSSRLRISVTAGHNSEDIDRLTTALGELLRC